MKKYNYSLLLCCLLCMGQLANAQKAERNHTTGAGKNIIKANLSSLLFMNASLQYERIVKKHTTVALGASFMPRSPLPFEKTLYHKYGYNTDAKRALQKTRLDNFSITPEIRFYLGKKAAPTGFYVAPFLRYNQMHFEQLYDFTDSDNKIYFPYVKGTLHNFGGGLLVGAQWALGKMLTIDWWIAGPMYGITSGTFKGTEDMRTMSAADKQKFKRYIEEVPIPLTKIDATISDVQVDVTTSGPFLGLRAFGIALGVAF